MVRHEGGRWDVGSEGNAVYVERISENDEELFDDLLSPEEARGLAGLLTKYADKAENFDDEDEDEDDEDDEDDDDEEGDSGKSSK